MSSDIMAPHVCARNPDVANKLKAHTKSLYYGKYMTEEVSYTFKAPEDRLQKIELN